MNRAHQLAKQLHEETVPAKRDDLLKQLEGYCMENGLNVEDYYIFTYSKEQLHETVKAETDLIVQKIEQNHLETVYLIRGSKDKVTQQLNDMLEVWECTYHTLARQVSKDTFIATVTVARP